MKKNIILINSNSMTARGFFKEYIEKFNNTQYADYMDFCDNVLKQYGWNGIKHMQYYQSALSIKRALFDLNYKPYFLICEKIDNFLADYNDTLLVIDMAETDDMKDIVSTYPNIITTVLLKSSVCNPYNIEANDEVYDWVIDAEEKEDLIENIQVFFDNFYNDEQKD